MNMAVICRDFLNRTHRGLELLRQFRGAAQWDDYAALHAVEAIVRNNMDGHQRLLADACAPWFEVRQ